jgi:signal-transduction protein with cAMP-binding, CBS, and nucleotidyltransferase domain
VLSNSDFFKGLPFEEIRKIAEICYVDHYEAGQYIFHQGDYGNELFIIIIGQVFLERTMNIGKHRGHVVIDALENGCTLGCWSGLLGQPHLLMSSANCQEPTQTLVLNGGKLREMMLRHSDFGFNILERLCIFLGNRIQAAYGAMDKI